MHQHRVPSFIKETLIDPKSQSGPNTGIVGDFNTTLSPRERSHENKLYRKACEWMTS